MKLTIKTLKQKIFTIDVWEEETVFEVKEKGYTEVHKREQFTNELALVYEDGRTLVLGDKKREDEDAERTFADGAA